jgi:hypothetical protein
VVPLIVFGFAILFFLFTIGIKPPRLKRPAHDPSNAGNTRPIEESGEPFHLRLKLQAWM